MAERTLLQDAAKRLSEALTYAEARALDLREYGEACDIASKCILEIDRIQAEVCTLMHEDDCDE